MKIVLFLVGMIFSFSAAYILVVQIMHSEGMSLYDLDIKLLQVMVLLLVGGYITNKSIKGN